MTAPSDIALPRNFAAGIGSVLRFVVPLPCATGDDSKPMGLLPRRRLATPVPPIVGGATGATGGGHDLGGGVIGKLFSKGHGQTIARKNKSAMPKIILAIRRQCRHIARINQPQDTMQIIATSTGFLSLNKAIEVAEKMNACDEDWKYTVEDCKNGYGRIDVLDEDGEIVIKGFLP